MKLIKQSLLACCVILILGMIQGCSKDTCEQTQELYIWKPVYKNTDAIQKEFAIEAPRILSHPGKIYFYDNYIFIAEPKEGIHIIDNHDPSNPTPINFIKIPGTKDMAVKNGRLYADNYIDLLTIDISDPTNPQLVSRTEQVFKDYELHQDLGYLIEYERTLETMTVDCNSDIYYSGWGFCDFCELSSGLAVLSNADFSGAPSGPAFNASVPVSNVGVGGSFARFTIAKDHLYTVDEFDINTFDLQDCDNPAYLGTTNIGWGIETIYPLGENLFIGSTSGMFIYSIATPEQPEQLSRFEHARACDPVFVNGNTAYVTLRDGNACGGFTNQLDVVDVTNLTQPLLIASHAMDNPHGLSIQENNLFICEGSFGLKVK